MNRKLSKGKVFIASERASGFSLFFMTIIMSFDKYSEEIFHKVS
jgi:hypothetical protein